MMEILKGKKEKLAKFFMAQAISKLSDMKNDFETLTKTEAVIMKRILIRWLLMAVPALIIFMWCIRDVFNSPSPSIVLRYACLIGGIFIQMGLLWVAFRITKPTKEESEILTAEFNAVIREYKNK